MKNYLALDLGVGSIGAALLRVKSREEINQDNIHLFVRIFDTVNGNIDRRVKRLTRRTLDKKTKEKNTAVEKACKH